MPIDTTHTFKFYKKPFLVLTPCLSIGVLLGFEMANWSDLFPVFAILLVFTYLILYVKQLLNDKLNFGFILSAFILIGIFLIQSREGLWDKQKFSEINQESDVSLVKLRDVGQSDKVWKKMTGDIIRLYQNKSEIKTKTPLVLFVKSESFECESGDVLLVSSEISEIKNAGNPGEFDAKNYWNKKGFRYMSFVGEDQFKIIEHVERSWMSNLLNTIRLYLKSSLENNLDGKELAIALALILGDKSLIDQEITASFTNTGAMHVLAVSGLHIGIIMQILMAVMGQFSKIISRRNAILSVVGIMWVYAILTGLSPSVLRAVIMFTGLVIAQLFGKNHNSLNSLFATGFLLILIDPYTLYDIGFQLSFLAMLGIFLFYRPIEQIVYIENKWLRKVWQGTAIGFAAQLMTTPLSLYYFHQFPNYFILTNIGLMASSGLILGLGIFLFTINWWTPLAKVTGVVLSFIIFISLWFIEWVEKLPGAVAYGFEVPIWLVVLMSGLILILFLGLKRPLYFGLAYCIGVLFIGFIAFKRYQNHTQNEICIFNAKQVIITIRKEDKLFCFFRAREKDFDKVKFAVEGYQKIHPGKITYLSLLEKKWHVSSNEMDVQAEMKSGKVELNVNGKKYFILLGDDAAIQDVNSFQIGMPWFEGNCDYSLNKGAFVCSI